MIGAKWILTFLAVFTFCVQPVAAGEAQKSKAEILKEVFKTSQLGKANITIGQVVNSLKGVLPSPYINRLELMSAGIKDQKLNVELVKYTNVNGEESYKMMMDGVVYELAPSANVVMKINGVSYTQEDVEDYYPMQEKLNSQFPHELQMADYETFKKAPTIYKLQYLVKMRELMVQAAEVQDKFQDELGISESTQSSIWNLILGEQAIAKPASDPSCIIAGYTGKMSNGKCGFKGTDIKGYNCSSNGKKGVVCNPAIFGTDDSGAGYCSPISRNLTSSCNEKSPLLVKKGNKVDFEESVKNMKKILNATDKFTKEDYEKQAQEFRDSIEKVTQVCKKSKLKADQKQACNTLETRKTNFETAYAFLTKDLEKPVPQPPPPAQACLAADPKDPQTIQFFTTNYMSSSDWCPPMMECKPKEEKKEEPKKEEPKKEEPKKEEPKKEEPAELASTTCGTVKEEPKKEEKKEEKQQVKAIAEVAPPGNVPVSDKVAKGSSKDHASKRAREPKSSWDSWKPALWFLGILGAGIGMYFLLKPKKSSTPSVTYPTPISPPGYGTK